MSGDKESRDPDEDPGLARERTALAWTRTALSFGAVGGVIVKSHVIIGLIVLGIAPLIWQIGRLAGREPPERAGRRNRLITGTLLAVALVALTVSFLGRGTPLTIRLAPAHRPLSRKINATRKKRSQN